MSSFSALGPAVLQDTSPAPAVTNVPTAGDAHNSGNFYSRMFNRRPEGPLVLSAPGTVRSRNEPLYRVLIVVTGISDDIVWMTADEENHIIAPANTY